MERRKTRQLNIGGVKIGGRAPVVVQSMTNTFTRDSHATLSQIGHLSDAGCEVVRVAVPDMESARALGQIKKKSPLPVIADIHFDYRLALKAIDSGIDGLRLNPGNIGGKKKIAEIVGAASANNIPIRIGVNSGSLERDLLKIYGSPTALAMVESARRHIRILEDLNFNLIKISLKSSDVLKMVSAYRIMSREVDYPLHIGVTEAGSLVPSTVKSSIGIGLLLSQGIGDTIRVSITGDPVDEVRVAYKILNTLGLRERGVEIISCPTCGRCEIDLTELVKKVEAGLEHITAPLKVAVMGCVVNGPGEAEQADVGIAGGRGQGILFKKGKLVRKVPEPDLAGVLLDEVKKMVQ